MGGGNVLLHNEQIYDAQILYLCAYELSKSVIGCNAMHCCVALENLSHIAMIAQNVHECCDYVEQIIKILNEDKAEKERINAANNDIDIEAVDNEDEEDENDNDHSIKLLNIRCFYCCVLSLHCYEISKNGKFDGDDD